MASNPVMPKLDDSASDASSVDSRGRRRRRNNKQLAQAGAGGLTQPAVLPRLADTKPVRLQLGLNLDVEVELKARLQEEKPSVRPETSTELKPDWFGVVQTDPSSSYQRQHSERLEMFYLRVARLSFRQAWVEREVSPSLTWTVMVLIGIGGFLMGVGASRWWDLVFSATTTATTITTITARNHGGMYGFGGSGGGELVLGNLGRVSSCSLDMDMDMDMDMNLDSDLGLDLDLGSDLDLDSNLPGSSFSFMGGLLPMSVNVVVPNQTGWMRWQNYQ